MKGFALLVSLLLLLVLTIFGFSMLLMAGSHYGSTRSLFENENAKLACQSALWSLLHGYNTESEEFRAANPPQKYWSGLQSAQWNEYSLTLRLASSWNEHSANLVHLSASRGRYIARLEAELRQRRLEDFAFYSDVPQLLTGSSVFDGLVFVRGELSLEASDVQFHDIVQADIFPSDFATYRRKFFSNLDFPELNDFLQKQFPTIPPTQDLSGFWESDHYALDLDQLRLVKNQNKWSMQYKGKTVGEGTVLYFDHSVRVKQTNLNPYFHITSKPAEPLYVISAENISIDSSLSYLNGANAEHPVCLMAKAIYIDASAPRACVIGSLLVAFERIEPAVVIEPGGITLSASEKDWFVSEIEASAFLIDSYKKTSFIASVTSDQKVVWFRGGLALASELRVPEDIRELHFQAASSLYSLLPSMNFTYPSEGRNQWR